jgi:hypothetical protein
MQKEIWKRHIEETSGLIRPSLSGEIDNWKAFLKSHCDTCQLCKARLKTRRANRNAREHRQVYADLGMTRVVGALGGVYYE